VVVVVVAEGYDAVRVRVKVRHAVEPLRNDEGDP
jgi:hypothetical protein